MSVLQTLQHIAPLRLALIIACTLLAGFCVVYYYRVSRYRRGTLEWIANYDKPPFTIPAAHTPQLSDIGWSLLVAVLAAGARLAYLFFHMRWYRFDDPMQILRAAASYITTDLIAAAVLAVALYLLARALFGKPVFAIFSALVGTIALSGFLVNAALLAVSFLFLYYWLTAKPETSAVATVLLLASALCYAASFTHCRPVICFAPLYAVAYIAALVSRWHRADRETRRAKLILTLVLTVVVLSAAFVLFQFVYNDSFGALNWAELKRSLDSSIGFLPRLRRSVRTSDWYLFAAGIASLIPLLHGMIKRHDTRCLLILLLMIPFVAVWICFGVYLLPLVFALSLGYTWQVYYARGSKPFMVCSAAAILVFYLADLAAQVLL